MVVLFIGGSFKKEKKRLKCFPVIYEDSQRLTRGVRGFAWSVNLGLVCKFSAGRALSS